MEFLTTCWFEHSWFISIALALMDKLYKVSGRLPTGSSTNDTTLSHTIS